MKNKEVMPVSIKITERVSLFRHCVNKILLTKLCVNRVVNLAYVCCFNDLCVIGKVLASSFEWYVSSASREFENFTGLPT